MNGRKEMKQAERDYETAQSVMQAWHEFRQALEKAEEKLTDEGLALFREAVCCDYEDYFMPFYQQRRAVFETEEDTVFKDRWRYYEQS
jgi:hypothetical protein